jgi:23S rRNA (guanosine2251-2'-O)-methyltransferase
MARAGTGRSRREVRVGEFLYGRNAILEALRAGRRRFHYLAVARGVQPPGRRGRLAGTVASILELASVREVPVREVERRDLDDLVPGNQGLALQASEYPYEDLDAVVGCIGPNSLLLLLDCLEDPQNLGTLLRTAEAVQVGGVLIPEHRAAAVTPAVSNASAGAVEHLAVARVGNLVQSMAVLRRAGVWLVGLEDVPGAMVYDQLDWRGPMALVVGSEGRGMRRLVREQCDLLARLPMAGRIGSLNAAVAGSIALYHAWRVRMRR